jgi:hypothetical protein
VLVERHSTPYAGLVTFIVFYFAMFWAAWRFAVRVTEPRRGIRERGEPSAVLLGAYAAESLDSVDIAALANVPPAARLPGPLARMAPL